MTNIHPTAIVSDQARLGENVQVGPGVIVGDGCEVGDDCILEARAVLERAWEIRATNVADAGAREQTAFSLARAVWDSAPADRAHALELGREAREGYAAIPDLAPRLAAVEQWLDARTSRRARASGLGR